MITITVDTRREYDAMLEFAQEYVCRQTDYTECKHFPGSCDACFNDNHVRCGICIDIKKPNEL